MATNLEDAVSTSTYCLRFPELKLQKFTLEKLFKQQSSFCFDGLCYPPMDITYEKHKQFCHIHNILRMWQNCLCFSYVMSMGGYNWRVWRYNTHKFLSFVNKSLSAWLDRMYPGKLKASKTLYLGLPKYN